MLPSTRHLPNRFLPIPLPKFFIDTYVHTHTHTHQSTRFYYSQEVYICISAQRDARKILWTLGARIWSANLGMHAPDSLIQKNLIALIFRERALEEQWRVTPREKCFFALLLSLWSFFFFLLHADKTFQSCEKGFFHSFGSIVRKKQPYRYYIERYMAIDIWLWKKEKFFQY